MLTFCSLKGVAKKPQGLLMRAGGKMLWMMGKHFWQTTADNDHLLGGWLLLCISQHNTFVF